MPSNPERLACLTLDLEEDHAGLTEELGYEALPVLPEVCSRLQSLGIPLTIFVAGNFLEKKGHTLGALRSMEFHSHGFHHPSFKAARDPEVRRQNIIEGLKAYERFFGKLPLGYRAPYGIYQTQDLAVLHEHGIKFDSSLFPGVHVSGIRPWLSSRPRYYPDSDVVEFPISSLFALRLPYSLSYMRLVGSAPYQLSTRLNLLPNPVIFDFHLHDLVPTPSRGHVSQFFKWVYGEGDFATSWGMLENWAKALRDKGFTFITMSQLHDRYLKSRSSAA